MKIILPFLISLTLLGCAGSSGAVTNDTQSGRAQKNADGTTQTKTGALEDPAFLKGFFFGKEETPPDEENQKNSSH